MSFTLNMSPSTARLMQRMELEMLVPEMRVSGYKTRKPCSLSTNQDPPSERPSRCTRSPQRTGISSLETATANRNDHFYTVHIKQTQKFMLDMLDRMDQYIHIPHTQQAITKSVCKTERVKIKCMSKINLHTHFFHHRLLLRSKH